MSLVLLSPNSLQADDTGLRSPTVNTAETTSAGDNNGYQTSPSNAHADDTFNAVDTNSGTNTNTSCTNTGKDRHRFYNYGFNIPGGSTINGIEVRLDARADSASGTPKICVQLSWDGGATWTTAKTSANLTTALATYTLGSAADNWGRAWSLNDFSNPTFRVRLINVSSSTARDFTLDWVAVRIHYAPPLPPALLTIIKSGTGAGTVTSSPAGIDCGATCSASFAPGSVQLTATATPGSTFAGFSGGGCGATSPCTVNLSADTTVTAPFNDTQAPTAPTGVNATTAGGSQINLSWSSSTDNMGVAGYWIERCLISSCAYARVNPSLVTGTTYNDTTGLAAGTAYSYRVQGADPAGNTSAYSTVATASTFATLTLSKAGTGSGTVTSNPAGLNCGATCSASYAVGTSVTLTAAPTGAFFAGFSDGCVGTETTCTFTVTTNAVVTATFNDAGQLTGTITRSTDSAPLNGAWVEALQAGQVIASMTTPVNGNYLLGPLPPGIYDLRTSHTGYETARQNGISVTGGSLVATHVALTPTDTVAPAITITFPGDQAALDVKTVTVSGTIDDPTSTVTVNGVTAEISSGLYSAAGIMLLPGPNDLTIRAVDPFGNAVTQLRTVFLEAIPPIVQITLPAANSVLSVPTVTVTGTIDDPTAPVTVNGVTATVNGNQFTVTDLPAPEGALTLTARAEDPAGNIATDARTVTLDRTPPTISLTVPSETAAGQNVAIYLEATDNLGLREIALSIDGRAVASFETSPANFTYTVPPDTPVGTVLSLLGQAVDGAGLTQGEGGSVLVNVPTQAPGFAQGRVLDDALGLPLIGVTVTLDTETTLTDAEGTYLFNRLGGPILLSFTKPGYTEVERSGEVPAGQKGTLLDARLTPIDSKDNPIGASGGRGSDTAGTVFLEIPAGALASDHSVRITEINNQGLINRLPLGWSPVAAVDLGVVGQAAGFSISGVLTFPNRLGLSAGSTVVAARYDRAAHAWRAITPGTVVVDGRAITLSAPQTGQYLLLLADTGGTAPPAPVLNALLEGASVVPLPNIQVTGAVLPKSTVPGGPVQGIGEVVVTADQAVASGLRLSAKVAEQFDLRDQTQRLLDFTQDLIVYQWSGTSAPPLSPPASRLSTKFPITPSQTWTLSELALGKVTVDFTLPPQDRAGSLVGAAGGTLPGSDGLLVSIPAGALASETLARVEGVAASSLSLPTGWAPVRSVLLDLTQAQLTQSAQISMPTPTGLAPNRPILIGRIIHIQGERGLKWVAFGKISGSLLVSTPTLFGMTLPGIRQGGEYLLVQPTGDVGFVNGVVSGAGGSPKSGVRVKGPEGPFLDLTPSDGLYRLPLFTGSRLLTAQDLASAQQATQTVTLTANQTVTQNLPLASAPFAVASVTPANGAQIVPLDSPVVVQFNRAVSSVSLTAVSVQLLEGATPVETVLVRSGSGVSLYPRALKSATIYTVALSTGITDLYGNPLAPPVSTQFTTKSLVPPAIPPAGQITVSFPDANGLVTVSATQGTIATENHLDLFNATTGMTVSVDLQGNGSFSGQIQAELGDELRLLVRDPSGNVTMADPGPYRDVDGKTLIDKKGGVVRGEGEVALNIPPQVMEIPHIVKMTAVPEQTLPIPVLEGFNFLSGIQIDLSGALFKSEPKLSVPAPVGLPADATPFLARLEEIDGQMEYVIVNSAKVENGRITTNSPPFDGVLTSGIFLFLLPPPTQIPVVLTGRVYKDGNGNNIYDPENVSPTSTLKDLPVRGAVVRVKLASVGTFQLFPSLTNAQGVYALYALAGASDWNGSLSMLTFEVNATDPLSRASQSIFLSGVFDYFNATATDNRDIKLLDLLQIPDTTPPSLDLRVEGARYFGGTTEIGQPLSIALTAIDRGGISSSNVSLSITPTNDTFTRESASCTPGRCDVTYRYTPQNTGIAPYLISLQATVQDDQGNRAEKRLSLSAGLPGTQLQPDPTRAPSVIEASIEPPNRSIGVPVDQIIRIGFSEPVTATASNLILRGPDGFAVDADYITRSSSGQYVIEIRPRSNLKIQSTYQIEITDQITDNDPSPRSLTNPQVITFTTMTVSISGEVPLQNARDEAYFTTSDGRKYLLISNDGQGVALIDVSHPSQPRKIVDVPILSPPYGQTYGVAVSDQAHYTDRDGNPVYRIAAVTAYDGQTGFGTIRILAIDDPAPGGEIVPRIIGSGVLTSESNGVPFRVVIIDKYAYVATLLVGIQIVDIEKAIAPHLPGANILAGAIDTTAANGVQAWPVDIKAIGTHVFAVTQRLGASSGELISIDGANPLLAAIQGRLPFAQPNKLAVAASFPVLNPDGSEVVKDLAFVSNGTQLQIVDVTDITTLTYFSQLSFPEVIRSVAVDPDHRILYVGQGVATILVVDLRDTRNPRQIGAFALGTPGTLLAESGVLYVAGGTNGLMVAQISPGYIHFRAADQSPVIGAVTDGVTRVEVILEGLKEEGDITFTLADVNDSQLPGVGGWVDGSNRPTSITVSAITEASDGVIRARAKYEVPETFVRFVGGAQEAIDKESRQRVVKVTARKVIAQNSANPPSGGSNQTVILANEPLILQRPPVLLVHGVWSDKDVWGPFESLLQGDSKKFITVRADYSQSPYHNAGPFSQNYPVVPEYIEKLLGHTAKRQLAVTKVDVVVHSMGGLLVREYCRNNLDLCKQKIHKFITLDTPHLGSRLANKLVDARTDPAPQNCIRDEITPRLDNAELYTDLGAVDDLARFSHALIELGNQPQGIPSHAITATTPSEIAGVNKDLERLFRGLWYYCDFVPGPSSTLILLSGVPVTGIPLFNTENDRIVDIVSQSGGLVGPSVENVNNADHLNVHSLPETAERIKSLLELPLSGPEWAAGFLAIQ